MFRDRSFLRPPVRLPAAAAIERLRGRMRLVRILLLAATLCGFTSRFAAAAEAPAALPNIVFLLADDLGYGDVKSFGGDRSRTSTPHFDRLAREGMRFTDAHAVASVCVPSRVALMTGRYAWRFGPAVKGGPWGYLGTQFSTDQFTLARMLKARGYRTGYVGKWHLGTKMQTADGGIQGPTNVDYTAPLMIGPPQYGFDDSFILPGSLDMYPYAFVRNNHWVGEVTEQRGWSAFNRVGPAAKGFEDHQVLATFAHEAERFIGASAERDDAAPFFLYVALTSPHTPLSPSAEFEGSSPIGVYGDFVAETDHTLGRVLQALDRHGLAENTLVIATSDHGAASYAGRNRKATVLQMKQLEAEGHYCSGPFRGYKFSAYEGGFRVPFVARWPGRIRPGATSRQLVGLNDLMATLADVSGYALKPDQGVDSVSLVPLFDAPNSRAVRSGLVMQSTRAFAIRDGKWKLMLCPGSGAEGVWGNSPARTDAWKTAVASYGRHPKSVDELTQAPFVQLFDLDSDPGETNNLAAANQPRVKRMTQQLVNHIQRGRSTDGPQMPNGRDNIRPFYSVPKFVWQPPAAENP